MRQTARVLLTAPSFKGRLAGALTVDLTASATVIRTLLVPKLPACICRVAIRLALVEVSILSLENERDVSVQPAPAKPSRNQANTCCGSPVTSHRAGLFRRCPTP